jgi:hypothetical protein
MELLALNGIDASRNHLVMHKSVFSLLLLEEHS